MLKIRRKPAVQPTDTGVESNSIEENMLRGVAKGQDLASAVHSRARTGAGPAELLAQHKRLEQFISGLGPQLADLVVDPEITDVLVNSTQVWVDKGQGLELTAVTLGDENDVRMRAVHMAAACGKRLDDASPIVDGTLSGGIRLHAILPPLSASGTLISLRTSQAQALSMEDMIASRTFPVCISLILQDLIDTHANVLISGATGSGKTTLLATLLGMVSREERIVCIEEVSELRPDHPHVVHLQERRANVQGVGTVTLADLVRTAMRMRPDRIVLGECRGSEVRDVLTALNTGHDGGWATIHANAVSDVPARLAALGMLAGLHSGALAAQGAAAFDAVIQMRRDNLGRHLSEIGVLQRKGNELLCPLALAIDVDGRVSEGPAWGKLAEKIGNKNSIDSVVFVEESA